MSSELSAVAVAHSLTNAEAGRLAVNAMESSFSSWGERRCLVDHVITPAYAALG